MEFFELKNRDELDGFVRNANMGEYVVIDFETTGLDFWDDRITDIVLVSSINTNQAYYCKADLIKSLESIICDRVFHNWKFDVRMALKEGVNLLEQPGRVLDTIMYHHLYNETLNHDLDSIVQELYGDNYKQEFWDGLEKFEDAPRAAQVEYMCKDVIYTARLYEFCRTELEKQGVPQSLIEHQHQLAYSLFKTEVDGIAVDWDLRAQKEKEWNQKIDDLEPKMRASCPGDVAVIEAEMWLKTQAKYKTEAGRARAKKPEFNWSSSDQIKNLLYNKLRLPVQKKWDPKKKAYSVTTNDAALTELQGKHEVVDLLSGYRTQKLIRSTFLIGTEKKARNGRIYPSFNVTGTRTGRISHSGPNMGNIPSEGGIRGIFLPDEGHFLLSRDYSQLEVVVAAHFSQDKNLLRIVNDGISKHDITNESLGLDNRKKAKTVNFAMQYGCMPGKVAEILECSKKDGEYYWNKYWETYAGEKAVIDECRAKIVAGKPIINLLGRHTHYPTEFKNQGHLDRCVREGYSSLIQGSGADITNIAFYQIDHVLRADQLGRGKFTVHDECMVEGRLGNEDAVDLCVKTIMEDVPKQCGLSLELLTDTTGPMPRWEDK